MLNRLHRNKHGSKRMKEKKKDVFFQVYIKRQAKFIKEKETVLLGLISILLALQP